jgi:hypothetical protein
LTWRRLIIWRADGDHLAAAAEHDAAWTAMHSSADQFG